MLKVTKSLIAENINGYSEESLAHKEKFHKEGKAFLKKLAQELGPNFGEYSIRSNMGGVAVSGEITLHSQDLYVQLAESATSRGTSLLYRSCASSKDYCGNRNNFAKMREFGDEDSQYQGQVVSAMHKLIEQEQARKNESSKSRAVPS